MSSCVHFLLTDLTLNPALKSTSPCSVSKQVLYFGNRVPQYSAASCHCKKSWVDLIWLGRLSFNATTCTPIIPCWIWCCSYAITHYKINWISMQSVVKFICLLQIGAICLQYSLLVSQIFIVLLEIKLQYLCICCCVACSSQLLKDRFQNLH